MWNKCLRSGGSGIIRGGLGTSFVSADGSILVVIKGSVVWTMVGISGGEIDVAYLGQDHVIGDLKEPEEGRVGGAGAATIMECRTMEGHAVNVCICVAVVAVISKLGAAKGEGSGLSGG